MSSLPFDVLEETVEEESLHRAPASAFSAPKQPLGDAEADAALSLLADAERPLIFAGPTLCDAAGQALLARLAAATGVPAVGMESPRGINDPRLGAFAEVLAQADLILLLGKAHDFTLRFAEPPFVDHACRFAVIDPEPADVARAAREKGARLVAFAVADAISAAGALITRSNGAARAGSWAQAVGEAVSYRPPSWLRAASSAPDKLHPLELCSAIAAHPGQASRCGARLRRRRDRPMAAGVLQPRRRIINGVAGSIGASIPFAIAARLAEPRAPVIAVMGDGTFGFHMAEFDTAVRYGLPFVAVVGNDATLERRAPDPAARVWAEPHARLRAAADAL